MTGSSTSMSSLLFFLGWRRNKFFVTFLFCFVFVTYAFVRQLDINEVKMTLAFPFDFWFNWILLQSRFDYWRINIYQRTTAVKRKSFRRHWRRFCTGTVSSASGISLSVSGSSRSSTPSVRRLLATSLITGRYSIKATWSSFRFKIWTCWICRLTDFPISVSSFTRWSRLPTRIQSRFFWNGLDSASSTGQWRIDSIRTLSTAIPTESQSRDGASCRPCTRTPVTADIRLSAGKICRLTFPAKRNWPPGSCPIAWRPAVEKITSKSWVDTFRWTFTASAATSPAFPTTHGDVGKWFAPTTSFTSDSRTRCVPTTSRKNLRPAYSTRQFQ